jgi:hypothetical protein
MSLSSGAASKCWNESKMEAGCGRQSSFVGNMCGAPDGSTTRAVGSMKVSQPVHCMRARAPRYAA